MPFDFPNSPTTNQTVVAPNGATFVWDGVKWTTGTGPTPGLFLPLSGGEVTGDLLAKNLSMNPGGGATIPAYPVGNAQPVAELTPANTTLGQLVVQSQSTHPTAAEWTAVFGNWSTAGAGAAASGGGQKVAVYAGAVQSPGSGPVWALNTLVTRNAAQGANNTGGGPGNIGSGTPGAHGAIPLDVVTIGYELDWNNFDQDLPIGSGFGVGMWINMLGSYPATAAIYMSNVHSESLNNYGWHDGILFSGDRLIQDNTILDSTSGSFSYTDQGTHGSASHFLNDTSPYALQISGNHAIADIWATDNAPTVLRVSGTHAHVVDFFTATITGTVWNGAFSAASINSTPIGGTTPSAGAFTTLSATGAVSGAGFTNLFAAPPAIGGTTPAAGNFTQVRATQSGGGAASAVITQASGNASIGWYETGAGADARKWDALAGGGGLYFRMLNDSEGTANAWLTVGRTGATPTSFSVTVPNIVLYGATAINGFITITLNISTVYPPTAPYTAFGWNFLAGNGETDYWNNFTSATMAHTFWQRTGASAATRLMDIGPTGAVTVYGPLTANGIVNTSVNYQVPTSGASITMTAATGAHLIVNPAGTLAALTVTLPASPVNGQLATISTTQAITTLTLNFGGTFAYGNIGSMAAVTSVTFRYSSVGTIWMRVDKPA
jgi:hypothetical protein